MLSPIISIEKLRSALGFVEVAFEWHDRIIKEEPCKRFLIFSRKLLCFRAVPLVRNFGGRFQAFCLYLPL